jgi:hypothetical protein
MSAAMAGVLMPKPTATGSVVLARSRATADATAVLSALAAPVMPAIDT